MVVKDTAATAVVEEGGALLGALLLALAFVSADVAELVLGRCTIQPPAGADGIEPSKLQLYAKDCSTADIVRGGVV